MPEPKKDQPRLRGYVYVDNMQPRYSALLSKTVKGDMPISGMAQLYIELYPAVEIYRALDIALKASNARPAFLIAERSFGSLEIHSFSRTDIEEAGAAIQQRYGSIEQQLKPKIVSAQIITNVDPYEAQLITNFSNTGLMVANTSLFVLEVVPACFAALACNEAEKNADVTIVGLQWSGQTGRIYVSGTEAQVTAARDAAINKINAMPGEEQKVKP
jgi:hypothetical protein